MPDITMCVNRKCPKKRKCYRHEAIPSQMRQSFAEFKGDSTDHCFIPMHYTGVRRRKKKN